MFKHMKIRVKLLLMVVIPIIGMLIFAGQDIADKAVNLENLRTTSALIEFTIKSGALIHELQKERGLSTGFIASSGARFGGDLAKQRQETNRKMDAVREHNAESSGALSGVIDQLGAANQAIERIAATRSNIDELKLKQSDVIVYFTQAISAYLDVIAQIAILSTHSDMTREAIAYHAFLNAKEESGRERAILSGAFSRDRFNDKTHRKFVRIIAAQATFLELFSSYADANNLALFRDRMNETFAQDVEAMRQTALEKGVAGDFNIEPETWFNTITLKINAMKDLEDLMAAQMAGQAVNLAADARRNLILSTVTAGAMTVAALWLAWIFMTGITAPLNALVVMLRDIAEGDGDLTKRLNADRRDEIGDVCRWFNRFVENIHGIIAQVADTTEQVSVAAIQLHRTAEQIAMAAEKVASQSTSVATASEEMSSTAIEISRNCSHATDVSNRANDHAQSGSRVVQETLVGMQKIAESSSESARTVAGLGARSDQIGAIIGTIGDIANQTNLLALNAAIEAARAGEQGRGFAVVADEVRALAERTSKATKEISVMIQGIQKETSGAVSSMESGVRQVEQGMDSSRQSGEALSQILDAINDVTLQVHQIATAAEEQTAVTGEIAANIARITDVVQETAKGAHQTAGSASALTSLADALQQLVGRFKMAPDR